MIDRRAHGPSRSTKALSLTATLRAALTSEPQSARHLVRAAGVDQRLVATALARGLREGWAMRPQRGLYARGPQWSEAVAPLLIGWLEVHGPQTLGQLEAQLPLDPSELRAGLATLEGTGRIEHTDDHYVLRVDWPPMEPKARYDSGRVLLSLWPVVTGDVPLSVAQAAHLLRELASLAPVAEAAREPAPVDPQRAREHALVAELFTDPSR